MRLSPTGTGTVLHLEHTVPAAFAGSGAGALYVGPGWDVALLGLALWLRGELHTDPGTWEASTEVRQVNALSIEAWTAAITASGTATPDEIAGAVDAARAQVLPDGEPAPHR